MTPEEYAFQQALISAALARVTVQFTKFFIQPFLSVTGWLQFLQLLYPEVKARRDQSAALARTFYDSQRQRFYPDLPVLARELEPYQFEWFVEAMEPVRPLMSQESSPNVVSGQVAALAVREVENAGRRQIIKAVEADKPVQERIEEEQPQFEVVRKGGKNKVVPLRRVKGWARVATGRETCAFCLMLVSRGPVYFGADTAGLDLPDSEALKLINEGADLSEFMDQWHPNCDCKVVPVFDLKDWPGREESRNALELWKKATVKADEVLEENPDKKYYSFKEKRWLATTKNREAINQLRLMLDSGEATDWAALQAA